MSKLVTKEHSYADILKGSMAQTQNKIQKNPTHEKPVPATVLPNNLDTETKTSDCTPKEIYVEIIKMSSPSQNITPYPSNVQGTPVMPMTMGYEQFKPPQNNLNAPNSGRIKIESEYFLIYDVPGDGQCFFHALSLAITGNLSQSLVYRLLVCSEIYNKFDFYEDQLKLSHHSNISRHSYRNKMDHGNQWATSTKISVATRILQSNINIWLQERDGL